MLLNLKKWLADPDIAIDLGTANTRFYVYGCGMIAEHASIIFEDEWSTDKNTRSPLQGGVIVDIEGTVSLLSPMFYQASKFGLIKPRVLACTPTDATVIERIALSEAIIRAGGARVTIVPEPLAAAIGAGINIGSPYAQMIIDIGSGVTDLAIIAAGSMLNTSAIRTACSDIELAIKRMVEHNYQLLINNAEAARLIRQINFAYPEKTTRQLTVSGENLPTSNKQMMTVPASQIANCTAPVVTTIVNSIRDFVRELPPAILAEVTESGIRLTGGGALLPGMSSRIAAEVGISVQLANDPLHSVIDGAGSWLKAINVTGMWEKRLG